MNVASLVETLRSTVQGEVRFDDGTRALYATDASNYRQVPIGVVLPRSAADVVATVAAARAHDAPILSRGGGTSLAGQCCNVAVVMDMSKYMHSIFELDVEKKFARVEPGIVLDDLRNAAEKHTLTFGPDPATHTHCTIGGMIGNNSCGMHAQMAGKVVDNIEELEILTYDGVRMRVGPTSDDELESIIGEGGRRGQIYSDLRKLRNKYADLIRERYPKIPRRVSGYNLDSLLPEAGFDVAKALVGSESTCVVVLEAKCRLIWSPPARTLVVLGFDDVYIAGDHVKEVLPFKPIALEGMDDRLIEDMKKKKMHPGDEALLPPGNGWLVCEFGGHTKEEADEQAKKMMEALKRGKVVPSMKLYDDKREENMVWQMRESGLGATANVPGQPPTWSGWEDSAVSPDDVGNYLRDLRKLLEKYEYGCDLYGHFGQGCIHTRIDFDLETAPGIRKFRAFLDDAADLVVSYGGSLSGEHGDGQSKADMLPKMFGPELIEAFREFKAIWDPQWKMNPGKIVTPYHPTENLRIGVQYRPWAPKTYFQFPEDEGLFSHATLRCVGVGNCRELDKGTMCPSYMVTREEEHSTRGRAHLLFEMFQGEVIPASWKNESVKEALDLCLACKGCKGDCPVNVDMATYKAEFLSHYYAGRLRPAGAYAAGWIWWWSRLASLAPSLANAVMNLPIVKKLSGIAQEREMPRYASETFVARFRRREPRVRDARKRVMLWPDTFNNYYHPETAMAAVEVLEHAGYEVTIPREPLCCGRPLYDFGFLGMAKTRLRDVMRSLRPELENGTPIIGLEPSCISVFRDELHGLFPADEDAMRLGRLFVTLSEFIEQQGDSFVVPKLAKKALVQAHCHHKAIMKFEPEVKVMKKIGLDLDMPDTGCCGMAGAFGFESDHYEISIRAGERMLLPKVRDAAPDTLIIADGFSCREQIEQTTHRQGLHLAQVLQMALREGPRGEQGDYPERRYVETRPAASWRQYLVLGAAALGLAGTALMVLRKFAKKNRKPNDD
ncbi:MAG: FAD-binding oxidoreductase [Acidobacteriota bacterium]|nr:FAD-binding oxidoreductase [Acidobacteriota bacterium]